MSRSGPCPSPGLCDAQGCLGVASAQSQMLGRSGASRVRAHGTVTQPLVTSACLSYAVFPPRGPVNWMPAPPCKDEAVEAGQGVRWGKRQGSCLDAHPPPCPWPSLHSAWGPSEPVLAQSHPCPVIDRQRASCFGEKQGCNTSAPPPHFRLTFGSRHPLVGQRLPAPAGVPRHILSILAPEHSL